MTRAFFLFLSRQRTLRSWMETSHLSKTLTKRFIAGMTVDEEFEVCRRLHSEGILSTIDRLGENVTSLDEAAGSLNGYLEVLDRIHQSDCLPPSPSNSRSSASISRTEACYENVRELVCKAKDINAMVEIDMESSEYTDRTLNIVTRLHQQSGCVRAVVQAYLLRTRADVEHLNTLRIPCASARAPTTNLTPSRSRPSRRWTPAMSI
jgi:proline dehydrogenase